MPSATLPNIFGDPATLATTLELIKSILLLPQACLETASPVFLATLKIRVPHLKFEFEDSEDS
jgi:hypothetical protein